MSVRPVRRSSLGRVLVLAMGGVAVGAVVLTALITVGLARLQAPERAIRQLGGEADRIADLAAELPCDGRIMPTLMREFGPGVRFVPDGAPRSRLVGRQEPQGRTRRGGRDSFYVSRSAELCGRPGTLVVFEAVRDAPSLPEGFAGRLVVAAVVGLIVSAGVAFVLAGRISRPLGELAHSARSLAAGDARSVGAAAPADPAEIADLKGAFDGMVTDLREAREREEGFLLSVSHELRTPLTAIRGYGEALADGTARRPRHAGEVVARESKRLERLVQDLLDLARLQTGEFSVHPQSIDLSDVARSVTEAVGPAAEEGGVRIDVETDGPAFADTDPDRLHQIIANLVENAIRVTPRGGRVAVEVRDGLIAVVDSGPGIEQEDLAHAFERFYLWSKYKGERPVGSGLGLAIVGELARRLGVTVGVRSAPGEGSRFEIRFDA